jgi:hypothetical protein
MTELREKIDNGLNEGRILILGTAVLVGMTLRSVFQAEFSEFSDHEKSLAAAGLALLVLTIISLMLPASFHRLVEDGNDSTRLHHVLGACTAIALFLLAGALSVQCFVVFARAFGPGPARIFGGAVGVVAVSFWWLWEIAERRRRASKGRNRMADRKQRHVTTLDERVRNLLTEARLILPGVQALLGFQMLVMMSGEFRSMPGIARLVHAGSLGSICLSMILLISPAAYHRVVERGENTAHFAEVAGRFAVAALVPLAFGISGDFFVVLQRIGLGAPAAAAIAGGVLALFFAAWFAFPIAYRRIKGGFDEL